MAKEASGVGYLLGLLGKRRDLLSMVQVHIYGVWGASVGRA
jgi:hypothetical protein